MSLGPAIPQAAVVGGPPSIISPGSFQNGTYQFPGSATVFGSDTGPSMAILLDGAAGTSRDVSWETAGVRRWTMRVDGAAESGGDAGSNLQIFARDDLGASLGNVITLNRAAGTDIVVSRPTQLTSVKLASSSVAAYGATTDSLVGASSVLLPAPFNSAGNLLIQSRGDTSRAIIFATNIAGTTDWRWHFSGAGHLLPKNDTHDIGDSTTPYQVRAIYMKGAAGKGLFAEGVRVVGAQVTGWATVGWAGAVNRAAFDSATVTLPVLAQHVLAILKDIGTQGHGLIDAAGLP